MMSVTVRRFLTVVLYLVVVLFGLPWIILGYNIMTIHHAGYFDYIDWVRGLAQ